jgi:hypothetical protein
MSHCPIFIHEYKVLPPLSPIPHAFPLSLVPITRQDLFCLTILHFLQNGGCTRSFLVTFPYICLYYIPNCLFYSITLPSPLFLIPHLVVIAGLNVPYSYLYTFAELKNKHA